MLSSSRNLVNQPSSEPSQRKDVCGENVTALNTAQVFLLREDKSDMNMLRKKPSLFNSAIQQKLQFIIHFLQRLSAKFVQFQQFLCFEIFPAALRMSFCHLFLAISWIRKIQFTIKVYNGLEIRGRFLQGFVVFQWFFVPYKRLIVANYEDTVSISHSHYTDLIHQAIYWISLGTKLILESYLTWWNQMYTGPQESCTELLHLPLRVSSLVKYQQSGGGALSKRQPLFLMGLFDW